MSYNSTATRNICAGIVTKIGIVCNSYDLKTLNQSLDQNWLDVLVFCLVWFFICKMGFLHNPSLFFFFCIQAWNL